MQTNSITFTESDFESSYDDMTAVLTLTGRFESEMVGGIPGDRDGIQNFCKYQLNLKTEEDIEAMTNHIISNEVGIKALDPGETGELKESEETGLQVVRSSELGPWLADFQAKACMKQAASQVDLFRQKPGTKSAFAESGRIFSYGRSLLEPTKPQRIYLMNEEGTGPATSYFKIFRGRVQGPRGPVSIIQNRQCIAVGSTFCFQFRYKDDKANPNDLKRVIAMARNCGLGSSKSYECGKFKTLECSLISSKQSIRAKATEDAKREPKDEKEAK